MFEPSRKTGMTKFRVSKRNDVVDKGGNSDTKLLDFHDGILVVVHPAAIRKKQDIASIEEVILRRGRALPLHCHFSDQPVWRGHQVCQTKIILMCKQEALKLGEASGIVRKAAHGTKIRIVQLHTDAVLSQME